MDNEFKLMPALCLDIDGTVRRSKSGKIFIDNVQDIELLPGVEQKVWDYRNAGFLIVGVSNQGGVAHGFKSPNDIKAEMDATMALFAKNPFHMMQYCFHEAAGKIEPYCHRSLLRKPYTGMLSKAEEMALTRSIIIDWDKSLFVGDRPEDEQCAANANVPFMWVTDFLAKPISM